MQRLRTLPPIVPLCALLVYHSAAVSEKSLPDPGARAQHGRSEGRSSRSIALSILHWLFYTLALLLVLNSDHPVDLLARDLIGQQSGGPCDSRCECRVVASIPAQQPTDLRRTPSLGPSIVWSTVVRRHWREGRGGNHAPRPTPHAPRPATRRAPRSGCVRCHQHRAPDWRHAADC